MPLVLANAPAPSYVGTERYAAFSTAQATVATPNRRGRGFDHETLDRRDGTSIAVRRAFTPDTWCDKQYAGRGVVLLRLGRRARESVNGLHGGGNRSSGRGEVSEWGSTEGGGLSCRALLGSLM